MWSYENDESDVGGEEAGYLYGSRSRCPLEPMGRKRKLVNIKSKGFERQQQPTSEESWVGDDEIHIGPTTRQSARGSEDGK